MIKKFNDFVNENLKSLVDRYRNNAGVRQEDLTPFTKWMAEANPQEVKAGATTWLSYNFGAKSEDDPGAYLSPEEVLELAEILPPEYKIAEYIDFRNIMDMWFQYPKKIVASKYSGGKTGSISLPRGGYYDKFGEFDNDKKPHFYTLQDSGLMYQITFNRDRSYSGVRFNMKDNVRTSATKELMNVKIIKKQHDYPQLNNNK